MRPALKIEGVSKQYRLGRVGASSLRDDVLRLWAGFRRSPNPFLSRGEVNDRSKMKSDDYVWALKDINLTVNPGEVIGVIGKNGAGKSTLLKILSRITAPTTGKIEVNGRMASLLEVGTGFHPELTGRENIYLNGAILGMRRAEIKNKFDEIVEFSQIERYIDTPVKRYSSGMYVRLAFAVAAHLEPDILVVDEVLAVGDAQFQKKALGKMQSVSAKSGRTVIFVSHNMSAVSGLCEKTLVLENGEAATLQSTQAAIDLYLNNSTKQLPNKVSCTEFKISNDISIVDAKFKKGIFNFKSNEDIETEISFNCNSQKSIFINFILRNNYGEVLLENPTSLIEPKFGVNKINFKFPGNYLNQGFYSIQINFHASNSQTLGFINPLLDFEIIDEPGVNGIFIKRAGFVRIPIEHVFY